MKRTTTFNKTMLAAFAAFVALLFSTAGTLHGQSIIESFNDISQLTGNGWFMQNNSSPLGTTGWMQGGSPFTAYNGDANSYISANYNNVNSAGTISNWLLTPNRTFRNGDVITFFTRKVTTDIRPDRLEIRLSTNGASTNAGSSATTVGDFTTILLSVNPNQETNIYPTTWQMYTITISGLPAPTSGRVAFRYSVTNAGMFGSNSDFIGIDDFVYTPYTCPIINLSPSSGALTGGQAGSAYSLSLSQTGALGAPSFAITAGALPPGLTLSAGGIISGTPTATGTFNFTVTVSDASGCSGSTAYFITVICPANPTSFNGLPQLCSNDEPYTLIQGSPAGGTYSGTGVFAGQFDPAVGTQTITYDYTDPYGCAHASNATITVNSVPSVTASTLDAVCEGSDDITLSFGSPAGGTYSGISVTSGVFTPAKPGTTSITYSYTDANGCTSTASSDITVNDLPAVTASLLDAVCEGSDDIVLSFGSPAGGTYSGISVTSGVFTPAKPGTTSITYSYTDANGCTATASSDIIVNDLPAVTVSLLDAVCKGSDNITLSLGSPAGGTYIGTNVDAGVFAPSIAGTTTITYSYTDVNGCSASSSSDITVNDLPTVTAASISDVCKGSSDIILDFGFPAGGTYSGTNVTSNVFTPSTAGTTTITYSYTDANGCLASASSDITVNICTGITNSSIPGIKCYPNPSTGIVVVEFEQKNGTDVLAQIIDSKGRVIVQDKRGTLSGNYSQTFDLSSYPKGMYTVSLRSDNKITYYKLIVQ